jgi:hypothetical protein
MALNILSAVNKLLNPGVGGSGVRAAARDLWAIYGNPAPPTGATLGPGTQGDDGTVAIVGVAANETAAAIDVTGAAVSTTTPVGTTTYTSKAFYTQGFAQITGICFANNSGSVQVQQSGDGLNWDRVDATAVTGGTGASFSVAIVAPYARVVFVPTGSNTTLRFFTFLRRI